MLIIIALPQPLPEWQPRTCLYTAYVMDRGGRFERSDYLAQRRADLCGRAIRCIRQHDDAMHVVWHHHKRVDFDTREPRWNIVPQRGEHVSRFVKTHAPVDDIAKQTGLVLRANRDEIGSGLRVIVPLQAKGTTASGRLAYHNTCSNRRSPIGWGRP